MSMASSETTIDMNGTETKRGLSPLDEDGAPENELVAPGSDSRLHSATSNLSSRPIPNPRNLHSARMMRTPVNENALITELTESEINEDGFDEDYDSLDETDIFEDILQSQRDKDGSIGPTDDADDPGTLSDETELEVDLEGIMNPDRIIHDTTGRTEYMRACNTEETTPVSIFLRNIQEKQFIMRYRGLGPKGTKAIAVPLEHNTTIERLDLEGNSIEAEGAIHLANMLKENYYITELMLAENEIGNRGTKALCEMLQDNHTVLKVDLSGNGIDDEASPYINDMLKKNTSLKQLNLSHNSIGNTGARLFKEVLADNESLETLDLSWNQIRTQGTVWLAEGIQENIGLKYLYLSMNGMGIDGAREMGKALKQNRSLLELDISYNRIPIDACVFLASGIQANDTLRTLKMGSNPLGDDGSMAILAAVDKNDSTALTCFDLTNVVVTGAFERLKQRLAEEKGLRVIHGGVVGATIEGFDFSDSSSTIDPIEAFKRDPMSKLKEYVQAAGYRMLDLFKQFDKDQSMSVTRKEFIQGMQKADLGLSDIQINILLSKIDQNGDGSIDYGELLSSDKEFREKQREMLKLQEELDIQK